MRALVAGWFSFEGMGATAGDLIARDVVCDWLRRAGCPYDVAVVPPFAPGIDWRDADPASFTHVVFVCGPFGDGEPVSTFLRRFSGSRLIGVDLSMLQSLDDWDPFDLLIERDSSRRSHPDVVFLADIPRVPVVGLSLIHVQPEYGERDMHARANAALRALLSERDVAVVPIDTRLDEDNLSGLRSPSQVASLFGAMDIVVTTRLHGMVLALKAGVPAVAIDPVRGGGKIERQAAVLGWPLVLPWDVDRTALNKAFEFGTTSEAHALAAECRDRARRALRHAEREFLGYMEKEARAQGCAVDQVRGPGS